MLSNLPIFWSVKSPPLLKPLEKMTGQESIPMASTSTMKGAMAPKMFKSMAAPGSRWQKNLKIW